MIHVGDTASPSMVTGAPFGLVVVRMSVPALTALNEATAIAWRCTVVALYRFAVLIVTLFQRTVTTPQDGHFVTMSHKCLPEIEDLAADTLCVLV